MTLEPLIHMPSPGAMASAAMVRSHVYNTICQIGAAHTNYYVYNNNRVSTPPNQCTPPPPLYTAFHSLGIQ
jgi:hypothetical protein